MDDSGSLKTARARLTTGIPGLDTVLRGGFFRAGIYIIEGPPGAGKTILANQICFHEVAAGHHALYVTLLAESHARLMANLSTLTFYDESAIPGSLYYVSAFSALEQSGLRGLIDVLRREIRSHEARVLIIDGLVSAEESVGSKLEMRKFVQELQSHTELEGCTTFLLTSVTHRGMSSERTMVDGLIELSEADLGSTRQRRLEVLKFRGSSYLRGEHAFEILESGIAVYPRIEALLTRPRRPEVLAPEKISTGSTGLDEILHGGLARGSTSMLLGPSGAGKTSVGLQFLSLCNAKETGVYLSFYETRLRAENKAAQLGLALAPLLQGGLIHFAWVPTTEDSVDRVAGELVDAVDRLGARRIFIDGLDGFAQLSPDTHRLVRIFTALTNEFRALGATAMYTAESRKIISGDLEAPPTGVSTMLENLISLRYAEVDSLVRRVISVLKTRDSDYDHAVREIGITNHGLEVRQPMPGWENLLGGAAHRQAREKVERDR